MDGARLEEIAVTDEGRVVVVLFRHHSRPDLLFARRVVLVHDDGRWDEIAAGYADIHITEDIMTGGVERAAERPADSSGLHWL